MKLSAALVPCLLVVAALWTTRALVEARVDRPLDVKLRACVELAKQPGVTDRHPLTACINLATADYRLLHRDWHQFYVTCVINKGTAEPSIYENWASVTADCVDHWADLP